MRSLLQKAIRPLLLRVAPTLLRRMRRAEEAASRYPGALHGTPDAPERFDILGTALARGTLPDPRPAVMPHLAGSISSIFRSLRELKDNPAAPKTRAPDDLFPWLEARARELGCASVGYARVPPEWVFRGQAVAFPQAVVLTMPMDAERIGTAPSPDAFEAVHETYHHLGDITNVLAGELRARGYGAQAGPPLNGLALYTVLAQQANLGWGGLHGLVVGPEHGSCMRLAAVYTSIENLPLPAADNPHRWVEDFCESCRACQRRCPVDAVHAAPRPGKNGLKVHVDADRCFPYFIGNQGCSVCIAVCPFTKHAYGEIQRRFRAEVA